MDVVAFVQDLVRIDSTPKKEQRAINRASDEMDHQGFDDVTIDRNGNLIGRIGPAGGRTLVLDAHIDTVPVYSPERWTHDPFGGEISQRNLYGRGAADMKGSAAAMVCAAGAVQRSDSRLTGCALVVVSIAEEMREGATLAKSFDGRPLDWCVIGEATGLDIATAQRGRAKVQIEITGRSSHAATPTQGLNAVELMLDLVARTKSLDPPSHPQLGHRDISLIDIRSEPYPSISTIPDYCIGHFDVRSLPGETRDSLLKLFRDLIPPDVQAEVHVTTADFETYVGSRYVLEDLAPPWETPRDNDLVVRAMGATGAGLSTYPFCTNGSYFAGERGIPTIGYGPGSPLQAHAVDEFVAIDDLTAAVNGYAAIIQAMLCD